MKKSMILVLSFIGFFLIFGQVSATPPIPTLCKPDLFVESITVSNPIPHIGESFSIKVTVKNDGKCLVPSPLPGKWEIVNSPPTKLSFKIGGETNPQILNVPELRSGQTKSFIRTFTSNYPLNIVVTAIVDPDNEVKERNEKNNKMIKTIRIWRKPDLRITQFYASSYSIRLPGSIKISAKVENQGGKSPATTMQFNIYGKFPNGGDILLNKEKGVSELLPNAKVRVDYYFTPTKIGTYNIFGIVDPHNRVNETNEHNNTAPRMLRIIVKQGGADLDLISATPNHTKRYWYQYFEITAVVLNRGNLSSGAFKVHLYRLHDKGAGIAQGTKIDMVRDCPSLAPNETCTVKFKFRYKIFLGDPKVEIKVDPERKVNDYNRANNQRRLKLSVI